MANELRYFLGREGFHWFVGVVEDRKDPDMLGRVRVRCFGWHTDDKSQIATEDLPWAQAMFPTNGVNITHAPKEGDWVLGFFMDGASAQHPAVIAVLQGMPKQKPDTAKGFSDPAGVQPKRVNEQTTNRLARGRTDGTVIETRTRNVKTGIKGIGGTWNEPNPSFSPQYPFNFAHETESGHAFELDDTEGSERVHIAHKNGSCIEWDAQGNRVEKIVKDKYTLTIGNDYVYVEGTCNITVMGDTNLKVGGNLNVEASKGINLSAGKDVKVRAGGKLMLEGNSVDLKGKGAVKVGGGGKLSLKGKSTAVQGNSVTLGGKVANKVKTKHGIGKILPTGSASSPSNTGLKAPS